MSVIQLSTATQRAFIFSAPISLFSDDRRAAWASQEPAAEDGVGACTAIRPCGVDAVVILAIRRVVRIGS
ncbi:hypothetical protein O1611_g8245 [Lasiodiplodia mahajangana]|uniref:Uncharacterized protein n=1 Tax=Lasiodiplodia mahajangana TaxID=1108764 RepID=A0ACC2JDE7_9PEZI|nr:hypothetical protein O1611_g8245 [Lasiodiplodia mahajangana]